MDLWVGCAVGAVRLRRRGGGTLPRLDGAKPRHHTD